MKKLKKKLKKRNRNNAEQENNMSNFMMLRMLEEMRGVKHDLENTKNSIQNAQCNHGQQSGKDDWWKRFLVAGGTRLLTNGLSYGFCRFMDRKWPQEIQYNYRIPSIKDSQ
jgi:hypothetical protein